MPDFGWGVQMMLVGMGVVFALLFALMGLLLLVGRLDRAPDASEPQAPAVPEPDADDAAPASAVRIVADGLDETQVAAIAIAVMTHAEVRRRSAGPEVRAAAPGSQLFASRWVAIGRGTQPTPFRRR